MSFSLDQKLSELITEAKMSKSLYVLLEGKTDITFWDSIMDGNKQDIQFVGVDSISNRSNSNNKKIIIEIIEETNKQGYSFGAIIDPDYDTLKDIPVIPNLYYYNAHSLETYLVQTSFFEKVLNMISSKTIDNKEAIEIRSFLYEVGEVLGLLRVCNQQKIINRHVGCNKLKVEKFFLKNKKVIQSDKNIRKYIQSIWALSQEEADLFMKNIDKNRGQIDPKYLCHGHDLFSILEVITGSTIIPIKKGVAYCEDHIFQLFMAYFSSYGRTKVFPDSFVDDLITQKVPHLEVIQ